LEHVTQKEILKWYHLGTSSCIYIADF